MHCSLFFLSLIHLRTVSYSFPPSCTPTYRSISSRYPFLLHVALFHIFFLSFLFLLRFFPSFLPLTCLSSPSHPYSFLGIFFLSPSLYTLLHSSSFVSPSFSLSFPTFLSPPVPIPSLHFLFSPLLFSPPHSPFISSLPFPSLYVSSSLPSSSSFLSPLLHNQESLGLSHGERKRPIYIQRCKNKQTKGRVHGFTAAASSDVIKSGNITVIFLWFNATLST